MNERAKIHNQKRNNWHSVFELQRKVEEAIGIWRKEGWDPIIKEFKKFVQQL